MRLSPRGSMVVYQAHVEVACSLLHCFSHQRLFYVPCSQRKAPCTFTTYGVILRTTCCKHLQSKSSQCSSSTLLLSHQRLAREFAGKLQRCLSVSGSHMLSVTMPREELCLCSAPVRRLSSLWSQRLQKACLPQTPACNKPHTAQRPHF